MNTFVKTNTQNTSFPVNAAYWEISGLQNILQQCCIAFGVTVSDVCGRSREEANVFARQAYCYLASVQTHQSAASIGKLIGRNHATVSYSIKTVENYVQTNYTRFMGIFNFLQTSLR